MAGDEPGARESRIAGYGDSCRAAVEKGPEVSPVSRARILTPVDVAEEPQAVALHVRPDRRAPRVSVLVDDRDLVRRHCKRTLTHLSAGVQYS